MLLREICPEFATELQGLLVRAEQEPVSKTVDTMQVVDRCRCGEAFCGTFYTRPKTDWHIDRTIPLEWENGYVIVDIEDEQILQVEILYRDDVRDRIHAAFS